MLEGRSYVPILHLRPAETRAYRELDSNTKNLILPMFALRPWLTAKSLSRSLEVLNEAVGDRDFALDLDHRKFDPNSEREAVVDFCRLFNPDNGFERYYEYVDGIGRALPVFRHMNENFVQIERQLEHLNDLARPFFVRVNVDSPQNFLEVGRACQVFGPENVCFVFDCGWSRSVQEKAARCVGLVNSLLDVSVDYNIVVAGSSFPEQFAGLGDRFDFGINERQLFADVRRALNRGQLIYGDWGSTREPREEQIPMRAVPRIDFAGADIWRCWRSDDGEDYIDLARRTMNDPTWDGDIGSWAEYMIVATAERQEARIKAAAMASAVRINSHLHQQANLENPGGFRVSDEPVGDDI